ncbi:uncharacterized protein LOC113278772 [Papaver somniferum]|uniref:uncharacterized protein LOC113278772 n=1 Tax=Papaver somniferum TaxID=3469 RepID=UPI000E700FBB|nr:uncharacterized protein LOC113278772 [Papaver somniferum]
MKGKSKLTSSAHAIFDDEEMGCDILSKLSAKSVLQAWEKHKVYFFTTDLPTGDARRFQARRKENHFAVIHTITKQTQFCYTEICGAVNGLICFVHHSNCVACIYNIIIREVTPWVQSTLFDDIASEENWERHQVADHHTSFEFGFDPATKDDKVICVSRFIISPEAQEDVGPYKSYEAWEVLELGDNAWRSIEEESPLRLGSHPLSIYVNGTIYRFPGLNIDNKFGQYLLAFDVGTDNFRMIQIPKFRVVS